MMTNETLRIALNNLSVGIAKLHAEILDLRTYVGQLEDRVAGLENEELDEEEQP